jgi:hypothetical protein
LYLSSYLREGERVIERRLRNEMRICAALVMLTVILCMSWPVTHSTITTPISGRVIGGPVDWALDSQVSGEIVQLTDNEFNDVTPQIDDGMVTWVCSGETDGEVFLFDGTIVLQLTDYTNDDSVYIYPSSPQIDDGMVTWTCGIWYDHTNYVEDVYFYDGTSVVLLTDSFLWDSGPQIDDGMITWQSSELSPYPGHSNIGTIVLYEGGSIQTIYANEGGVAYEPQIDDGIVVWRGTDYSSGDGDILLYDGTSVEVISTNPREDADPHIHNGMVTWWGWDGHDGEIFLYDGTSVIQLTQNNVEDGQPDINNGMVTWCGRDETNQRNSEIFLYDGTSVVQITDDTLWYQAPQIDDGMITWMGYDGHDSEIFLYDGTSIIQITDNEYDDNYPKIDDGMITWYGWDGNDYEIFLYRQEIPPAEQAENIAGIVAEIPSVNFAGATTRVQENRKQALLNMLQVVIMDIQTAEASSDPTVINAAYQSAIVQLNAILDKTDGCAERGTPDTIGSGYTPDWITSCESQALIDPLIRDLIASLEALLVT